MANDRADDIRSLLEPMLATLDLDLDDVVITGSGRGALLRVTVDRDGGVDLDAIEAATLAIAPALDGFDQLHGPYTLEVSSPGLERSLRRPEHFKRAVGSLVTVKARAADGSVERIRGTLAASTAEAITILIEREGDVDGERHDLALETIESARTVFEWGAASKPGKGSKPGRKREKVTS